MSPKAVSASSVHVVNSDIIFPFRVRLGIVYDKQILLLSQ